VICRVRERMTPHGGESKDAPSEWMAHFDDSEVEARARDEAPLRRSNRPFNIMKS
jgi:hypothetical protein